LCIVNRCFHWIFGFFEWENLKIFFSLRAGRAGSALRALGVHAARAGSSTPEGSD